MGLRNWWRRIVRRYIVDDAPPWADEAEGYYGIAMRQVQQGEPVVVMGCGLLVLPGDTKPKTADEIQDDIAQSFKEATGPKMAKRMLTGAACPWDDCIFPDCNWRMGCPRVEMPKGIPPITPPDDAWRNQS